MSNFESIMVNLKNLLESAKDLPTEKIATVGLILIGVGSIVKSAVTNGPVEAIEKAKEVIDVDLNN